MQNRITQLIPCVLCTFVACTSLVHAECVRQADGTWQCQPRLPGPVPVAVPSAQPTAMDIRVECPRARGSGTAVARAADGGTLVVTNHHVVAGQTQVTLHSADGESALAQVAAIDRANDLVLLSVPVRWPFVNLGGNVDIGTAVQFRAFDAGVTFRKYYGHVSSEYRATAGAGGYFATGRSVAGNSGGGVYCGGRLVGVVWGNPSGGTAFVPIGPVRRLLERVDRGWTRQNSGRESLENPKPKYPPRNIAPKSGDSVYGNPCDGGPCDCDRHWKQIEQRLEELGSQAPPSPAPHVVPTSLNWLQLAATALGVSTPIGVAIVAAGCLVRIRNHHRERGPGGPRDERFRNARKSHAPQTSEHPAS